MGRVTLEFVQELFKKTPDIKKYTLLNERDLIGQQFIRDDNTHVWREVPESEIRKMNAAEKEKRGFNGKVIKPKLTDINKDIEVAEALLAQLKEKACINDDVED